MSNMSIDPHIFGLLSSAYTINLFDVDFLKGPKVTTLVSQLPYLAVLATAWMKDKNAGM